MMFLSVHDDSQMFSLHHNCTQKLEKKISETIGNNIRDYFHFIQVAVHTTHINKRF